MRRGLEPVEIQAIALGALLLFAFLRWKTKQVAWAALAIAAGVVAFRLAFP